MVRGGGRLVADKVAAADDLADLVETVRLNALGSARCAREDRWSVGGVAAAREWLLEETGSARKLGSSASSRAAPRIPVAGAAANAWRPEFWRPRSALATQLARLDQEHARKECRSALAAPTRNSLSATLCPHSHTASTLRPNTLRRLTATAILAAWPLDMAFCQNAGEEAAEKICEYADAHCESWVGGASFSAW